LPVLPTRRLEVVPSALRLGSLLLMALGLLAFIGALLTDASRAWRAYHFNWLFFTSVAQGAVTLAVAVSVTRGLWSRPIRRIALSFVAFLPAAYLLVLPILLFGARHIFPWIEHPVAKKATYLNVPFLSARTLIGLGLLFVLDLVFAYWSLRPDLGRLQNEVPDGLRALYSRFTRNWRGADAEDRLSYQKLSRLGPLIGVVWAAVIGVLAWDFVMSLEPHWFSTMIGPYFFMGGFLGGIAATTVACIFYAMRGGQDDVILPTNFHDLGKMTFGFCVFWAYLFYSQFIVIWYGLLPIEQDWLIHRLTATFEPIMVTVVCGLFIFPFFGLLGVAPKRAPRVLLLFAGIVLTGLWFERYMLVYPSLYIGVGNIPLSWQEVGIGVGFLGILLYCVTWFASRFPLFQIWQPASEIELMGVQPAELASDVVR
jgi:hypothetical protein